MLSRWSRSGSRTAAALLTLVGCIPDELIHDPSAVPPGATSGSGSGSGSGTGAGGNGTGGTGTGAGSSGGAGYSCEVNQPGAGPSCGPNQDADCCATLRVPGGRFVRNYDGFMYTDTDYPATVSTFDLDRYEVTVGRLRGFIADWVAGYRPQPGEGKHRHLPGGALVGEQGWQAAWDGEIPFDIAAWEVELDCPDAPTFDEPGEQDTRPATCLDWYVAYAFCIWDGGFLPTAAEWNFAASGGAEQRAYPWSQAPNVDPSQAIYDCVADDSVPFSRGGESACMESDILPVGSRSPAGDGLWDHADLAGGVEEWVLDGTGPDPLPCSDCVAPYETDTLYDLRVLRGGSWRSIASKILVAAPGISYGGDTVLDTQGVRCARPPEVAR